jgi:hypothetical protein
MKTIFAIIISSVILSGGISNAQINSGGNFTQEQTVIGAGGGASSAGTFKIEGTSGQSAAGIRPASSTFNVQNGFWTAAPFAPTAAHVKIGGRAVTAKGRGIRNAFVTLTAAGGAVRTVITGTFGYYNFPEIESGQTVIISIRTKQFTFSQPSQIVFIKDEIDDLDFIAIEN